MLRDEMRVRGEETEWAWSGNAEVSWKEVDRKLRGIAKRRAALDAEEARWLREAERVQVGAQRFRDLEERRPDRLPGSSGCITVRQDQQHTIPSS